MPEIPMVTYWTTKKDGTKKLQDCSKEELLDCIEYLTQEMDRYKKFFDDAMKSPLLPTEINQKREQAQQPVR